jgi:rubrerythrin
MTLEDDILKGARSICPYLKELLGEEGAEHVDTDLQELLKRAEAGYQVDALILQVLTHRDETRTWFEEYLREIHPAEASEQNEKSFEQLTSKIAMQSPLYRCPNCNYEWHRRSLAQPIPKCPTHQVPLVLVV